MITAEEYGKLPNGEIAYLYTIVNRHGNRLSITNYGCRIVALTIKDKVGDYRDVVLGYDDLDGYVNDKHWMGAALGINVVNRTSGSTVHDGVKVFVSDGESKPEDAQDSVLFGDKLFDCIIVGQENQETIVMSCEHKLQNGKINISVSYCFSEDNQLIVSENVVSDTNIEFNFVQQVMLNLNGQGAIDGHTAIVNAKYVGSTHGRWTPSEYTPVEGRVNLNAPKSLKNLSKAKHKLIKKSDGLDLSYQLNINPTDVGTDKLFYAGRVRAKNSAIKVEVHTSKPNLYFYTANRLDGVIGKKQTKISYTQPDNNFDNVNVKKGGVYNKHMGFCIYPTTHHNIVAANRPYTHKTIYKFVVR